MNLTLIKRGRIIKGKHLIRANIVINRETNQIVKVYKSEYTNKYLISKIDQIIIAEERLILPKLIDINTDLGLFHENPKIIRNETRAALKGGILTAVNIPKINKKEANTATIKQNMKNAQIEVKYYTNKETVNKLLDMLTKEDIKPAGYYTKTTEIGEIESLNTDLLVVDLNNSANGDDLQEARKQYELIDSIIRTIKKSGIKVHFSGVTSWQAIEHLNKLIKMGQRVTYDTPLTSILYAESRSKNHVLSQNKLTRIVLARFLRSNQIYSISSHHRIYKDNSGKSIIQYLLPVTYTLLKKIHTKDISVLLKVLSENPARILGINVPRVKTGQPGDLVIFNPKKRWVIRPELNESTNKETILDGLVVRGIVEGVIRNGTYEQLLIS